MPGNKFGVLFCVLKESIYVYWPHCFRQLALKDISIQRRCSPNDVRIRSGNIVFRCRSDRSVERRCSPNDVKTLSGNSVVRCFPERIPNSIAFASPVQAKRRCPSNPKMTENEFWALPCVRKETVTSTGPVASASFRPEKNPPFDEKINLGGMGL